MGHGLELEVLANRAGRAPWACHEAIESATVPTDGNALGDLLPEELIGINMNKVAGSNPAPATTEVDTQGERQINVIAAGARCSSGNPTCRLLLQKRGVVFLREDPVNDGGVVLAAGVPPNLPPPPKSVPGISLQGIHLKIARLLLARGANLQARTAWGWTPLETAEKSNHELHGATEGA